MKRWRTLAVLVLLRAVEEIYKKTGSKRSGEDQLVWLETDKSFTEWQRLCFLSYAVVNEWAGPLIAPSYTLGTIVFCMVAGLHVAQDFAVALHLHTVRLSWTVEEIVIGVLGLIGGLVGAAVSENCTRGSAMRFAAVWCAVTVTAGKISHISPTLWTMIYAMNFGVFVGCWIAKTVNSIEVGTL